MGWREILLGLILAIVAYMVWLLVRMRALNRQRRAPPPAKEPRELREPRVMEKPAASEAAPENRPPDDPRNAQFHDHLREQLKERFKKHYPTPAVAEESREDPMEASWPPENRADFARQTLMDGVERELEQLREEVDALRGALSALREDFIGLREEFQQEIQATHAAQNASPLYSDAMQMAILGHDALTISERCGISRAEADLVVALVKNKDRPPS